MTNWPCHIAHNFGIRKLWWIWQFTTSLPKFYPLQIFILANLLCNAANPPMFVLPKCLLAAIRQNFVLYGMLLSKVFTLAAISMTFLLQ